MLKKFNANLENDGITLLLSGVRGNVADSLKKTGIHLEIGEDNFHFTIADAVEEAKSLMAEEEERQKNMSVNDGVHSERSKRQDISSEKSSFFQRLFYRRKKEHPSSPSSPPLSRDLKREEENAGQESKTGKEDAKDKAKQKDLDGNEEKDQAKEEHKKD